MAHQRQLIRQAVKDLLVVANTAAGANVTTTRVLPYRQGELPAISVYTLGETVELEEDNAVNPRELKRLLELEIAGWVVPTAIISADDAMDDLAYEIETAMHADPFFGGLVGDSVLESTEMAIKGEGDTLMGIVTLTYAVTYRTMAPEAPTALVDFLRTKATHDLVGGVSDTVPAVDEFTVQIP